MKAAAAGQPEELKQTPPTRSRNSAQRIRAVTAAHQRAARPSPAPLVSPHRSTQTRMRQTTVSAVLRTRKKQPSTLIRRNPVPPADSRVELRSLTTTADALNAF
ncbi:hypothetical protein KCP73_11020 [Salmonella enterica subsp. enterica]|nr:hypothetical protein KCP73_11020 [Salmonella enterica subsp. enterica]